jgi:hypothetical protein
VLCASLLVGATFTVPLAGASVAPRAAVRVVDLSQLAMVDLKVGYGLFITHGGQGCRTYVARTTDGGVRFSAPVHLGGCDTSIAADAHGDVFVYGRQLLVSHDDAATFVTATSFSDVDQIVTLGDSAWLATATCTTPTAASCPLELFVSSNGGDSWSLAPHQPSGAVGWSAQLVHEEPPVLHRRRRAVLDDSSGAVSDLRRRVRQRSRVAGGRAVGGVRGRTGFGGPAEGRRGVPRRGREVAQGGELPDRDGGHVPGVPHRGRGHLMALGVDHL